MQLQSSDSPSLAVNPLDLAWAAGFIDGEGTIRVQRIARPNGPRPQYILMLHAGNRDLSALERLQSLFGGTINSNGRTKKGVLTIYRWVCYGPTAAQAIMAMTPHFTIKEQHVQPALEFQQLLNNGKRRRGIAGRLLPLDELELSERDRYYNILRKLNAVGIAGRWRYPDTTPERLAAAVDALD